MGFFGKKKEKVVDWSEGYRIPKKRTISRESSTSSKDTVADLGFLGSMASNSSSSDISWDSDASAQNNNLSEKKTKLAKRLLDMTDKIEDLSNQIYHIKQRMDVIERKLKISFE